MEMSSRLLYIEVHSQRREFGNKIMGRDLLYFAFIVLF